MKTIPAIEVDGALAPSEPFPPTAVHIACNGVEYVVYEEGDALPEPPAAPSDDTQEP